MIIFEYLNENLLAYLLVLFVLGLLFGSFLNVVIYRYPKIMEAEFFDEVCGWLDENGSKVFNPVNPQERETISMVMARSQCPSCKVQIPGIYNIPVVSWLWLRGKCHNCKVSISFRYPSVELLTGLVFAMVGLQFGLSWLTLSLLFVSASLIALIFIDIDTMYLPDAIVYPILWLGLLVSTQAWLVDSHQAIAGAAIGYLSLWSVFHLFKLLTKKEGMGYGDFKLLAALGAWTGPGNVLLIIVLSSFVGAVFGIAIMLLQKTGTDTKIPFGPYLAIAGWVAILWGNDIIAWYLSFSGLAQ